MRKKAFIFPGQGAQKPFMGKTFYDAFLASKEVYQEAEEVLSMSITSKIFSSEESFLKETDFCQIALFVTSVAILKAVEGSWKESLGVCAGLSLGEYAALVASKKATFLEMLPVIQKRGMFMQKASNQCPQGMMAVLGLSERQIPQKYQVANINAPNQVVIAGSTKEMEMAKIELKELGAKRVVLLKVAGAFHTTYMDSAIRSLTPFIEACEVVSTDTPLIMNVTGKEEKDPSRIKRNLIEQVSGTTRWLDCVLEMERLDVDYVEIGPSQLCGINKKIKVKNSSTSIEEVKDMEKLYETI